MSSRVGTAIPASRPTALSSAAVGLTRSIQTALSGSLERSGAATFFSEDSEGTKTANMGDSRRARQSTQQEFARFWQALHTPHSPASPLGGKMAARRPDSASYRWAVHAKPRFCGKNDTGGVPQRRTGI